MKKIAMITGATGGIGLSTAKILGKAGYSIILNGIDKAQGKDAEKTLTDLDIPVDIYYFDV
ncbi:SDR family NAD(P)-dependent oxidoreductase, partial [Halolactibacillus halophilus]